MEKSQEAFLLLKNGSSYRGVLHGDADGICGEVIFNTCLTGYQEILTDPSYTGQIVCMTYPHIGNYGVSDADQESSSVYASALITRQLSRISSNWRHEQSLNNYLGKNKVPILEGIDVRRLTLELRNEGSMPGIILPASAVANGNKPLASQFVPMEGQNLVKRVSTTKPYTAGDKARFTVVAYDYGIKNSILQYLVAMDASVTVVPFDYPAQETLAMQPDGVFLSNGPGDPDAVDEAIAVVKELLGKVPIFGICLGQQILGLACGAERIKLNFGHHGGNHPVQQLDTKKVEICSHNHGFAITDKGLPASVKVTHRSLNDNTIEGIASEELNFFAAQYHPEGAPGPHDSLYLFDKFKDILEKNKHRAIQTETAKQVEGYYPDASISTKLIVPHINGGALKSIEPYPVSSTLSTSLSRDTLSTSITDQPQNRLKPRSL